MAILKTVISGGAGNRSSIITNTRTGEITLHDQVNATALKEQITGLREANQVTGDRVHGARSHMTHVAEVPMTVYNQSIREGWSKKDWKRWANKAENQCFRVTKGRL